MLQRIWGYKEKIFQEEQTDGPDEEEYSDSCKPGMERTKINLCEGSRPKESRQDEKEKSRSGSQKSSGCQRWWEVSNDWKSFVKTVEELCKRILKRDEDKKMRGFLFDWERR